MESNADFIINVSLIDRDATILEFLFQQDINDIGRIRLIVPRHYLEDLGIKKFAQQVTKFYFKQQPHELQRVAMEAVERAIIESVIQ